LLAALLACPAHAQAPTGAEIATYAGADRTQRLVEGARKEGTLLVYSSAALSDMNALIGPFEKKYGVKVQLWRGSSEDIRYRAITEYRNGRYDVDMAETAGSDMEPLVRERLLREIRTPVSAELIPQATLAHHRWIVTRLSVFAGAYNTGTIRPADVPKSYADLLDPKWKGKLGVSATESTLANWVGAMLASEGEDFVRRLGRQSMTLYNMGGRAVDNLVVSGEAPLVINSRYSHMFASRRDGAKVAWRALGPSYTAVSGVALPIRSQNPNAAMLFIDFMLSAQAQKIYVEELGYSSLRTDMINTTAPAKKLYLGLRPDYERDYESWGRLADQVFWNGR
jgi:iron(III) transport system substrate-binding protein